MITLRKPIYRVTAGPFVNYGPDRDRPFVVGLAPGDLITFRAKGRRAEVSAQLSDVWKMILIGRSNAERMKKLRERKEAKAKAKAARAWKRELRKANA